MFNDDPIAMPDHEPVEAVLSPVAAPLTPPSGGAVNRFDRAVRQSRAAPQSRGDKAGMKRLSDSFEEAAATDWQQAMQPWSQVNRDAPARWGPDPALRTPQPAYAGTALPQSPEMAQQVVEAAIRQNTLAQSYSLDWSGGGDESGQPVRLFEETPLVDEPGRIGGAQGNKGQGGGKGDNQGTREQIQERRAEAGVALPGQALKRHWLRCISGKPTPPQPSIPLPKLGF